jgi:flagellar biosynthesis protein FlhA
VFFIIVIVQFVVITSGANRVAEVAARFTLDAMPGKQMSIDADLNSGLITEDQARKRRKEVEQEADFYGAMDGASKFVKGDAIAAILVVFINLLGGFAVGVFQKGMPFSTAMQTYCLLTIGAGLITQIPALLISTATGVIVTRAASEANLGTDLSSQLMRQPQALKIGGAIITLIGLVPGLPKLPFLLLGIGVLVLGFMIKAPAPETEEVALPEPTAPEEDAVGLVHVDPMEVELGYDLIPMVDPGSGSDFMDRVVLVRRQIALELGMVVPPIRVRDNIALLPEEYRLKIRGSVVAKSELRLNGYLALNPGTGGEVLPGLETTEPAFGLPATWIERDLYDTAMATGYTVVDPTSVMLTHLTEVIRKHAAELLTRQDTQSLLDMVKDENPVAVEELVPTLLTVGDVQRVLQALLTERVSVRDMVTIVEVLGDRAKMTKDIGLLTEYVRQAMARNLSQQHATEEGTLLVLTMDPALEQKIVESVHQVDGDLVMGMDPELTERFINDLAAEVEKVANMGHQPVLVCSSSVRRFVRKLTERILSRLAVLSYEELDDDVDVKPLGMVGAANTG